MEYENKDICKKCGGFCCKKSGCDYYVSDLDVINKENLSKLLDTGNVSIVAAIQFSKLNNGKKCCTPFLYLRARNVDRDVIDLFSMKKQCSMLTDTGCMYDISKRPSGGVNLIPGENMKCSPLLDPRVEVAKWNDYQNILSKLVKRYSGMSVDARFRLDVENVFFDILTENFDGVSPIEIADVLACFNDLVEIFPDEFKKARARVNSNPLVLKKRRQ